MPKLAHTGSFSGYRSSKKEDYRRKFYDFVDIAYAHGRNYRPKQDRKVAILDTSLAGETLHLLKRGYLPHNIFVANHSIRLKSAAAFKASFTRVLARSGFPNTVNVFPGLSMLQMFEQIDHGVHVVNFDACSTFKCLQWDMIQALKRYVAPGVFGVTIQAGREAKWLTDKMFATLQSFVETSHLTRQSDSNLHDLRAAVVKCVMDNGESRINMLAPTFEHRYVSSRTPVHAYGYVLTRQFGRWTPVAEWERMSAQVLQHHL